MKTISRLASSIALAILLSTGCLPSSSSAQTASDKASNYGGVWANGSNGGTGFTVWDLSDNNNGGSNFAGYFLGDSTAGSGNINSGGTSFSVYANPASAFASASRGFAQGDLAVGQTFSLQLAVNFRNGNKGLTLNNGGTQLFGFNVGNNDYAYQLGNGALISLSLSFQPDSVFTLSFTRAAGTIFNVSIVRTSSAGGTEAFSQAFDFGGTINRFKFFNSGTDDGSNQNNLYFNNLAVVPEPSTLSLLIGSAVLGACYFRSRQRVA